tara:strand:+ start:11567 stop:11932 length:366 start_codon:yes stop_codon:yes gene_type:complete
MRENIYAFLKDGKRHVWDIANLWQLSKDFVVLEFEISNFSDMDNDIWFCGVTLPTVRNVYEHCLLINAADLSYPIILDPNGEVIDGVHRILKATNLGLKTLPAVKFDTLPAPDRIEDWPIK